MISTPYPIFHTTAPTSQGKALAAVGRCRVYPNTCCANVDTKEQYEAIVYECMDHNAPNAPHRKDRAVTMATKYLRESIGVDPTMTDVEVFIENRGDLINSHGRLASCFLDAGAAKIVVDETDLSAIESAQIPRDRTVAHFQQPLLSSMASLPVSVEEAVKTLIQTAEYASTISINFGELHYDDDISVMNIVHVLNILEEACRGEGSPEILTDVNIVAEISLSRVSSDVDQLAKAVGLISRQSSSHCSVALTDPTPQELGTSFVACLKGKQSKRTAGLYWTSIVTKCGAMLGPRYSSKESIVASLELGHVVFYSRSRNGLWTKGDTHGHHQVLHRIDLENDGEALRFTVTQEGGIADILNPRQLKQTKPKTWKPRSRFRPESEWRDKFGLALACEGLPIEFLL